MKTDYSWRPYFIATQERPLSHEEYSIVEQLLNINGEQFRGQLSKLVVVGRCGCEICPTIFFVPYKSGNDEQKVSELAGFDSNHQSVVAVLIQDGGVLTQLEFYSADGHQSVGIPIIGKTAANVDRDVSD